MNKKIKTHHLSFSCLLSLFLLLDTYNDKFICFSDEQLPDLDESLPDIKFGPTNKFIIGKKKPKQQQKEFKTEEIELEQRKADEYKQKGFNTDDTETESSSGSYVFNIKQPAEKATPPKASARSYIKTSPSDSVFTSKRTSSEDQSSSSQFVTKKELEIKCKGAGCCVRVQMFVYY